jgi:hypothetical protein
MSPVRYELGFYIPEDDILHSHRRESPKSHAVIQLGFIHHLLIRSYPKNCVKLFFKYSVKHRVMR